MGLFDWLRSKPAVPSRSLPLPAMPMPRLRPAPAHQPVPVVVGDATDRAVIALWTEFQRQNANASWSAFIASLTAANADLDAKIAKTERYLTDYPPGSELKR